MNGELRLPVFLSTYNMSKLKIKRLTLQYAYLTAENEEVSDICTKVEKEIRQHLEEKHPSEYKNMFSTPEVKNTSEDEEPQQSEKKNGDLKKLYRKIASKTHPDKSDDKKYEEVFADAAKAYRENDLGKILEIAGSLNLELLELSEDSINLLEKNIQTLSTNLNNMKQTVAWLWHNAQTAEEKNNLINAILQDKGDKHET